MWNMSPWSPHDTSISSYLICIPSACSMHCVCSPRPLSHLSVSMLTPGLVRTLECRLHTLRTTFRICVVTASTQGGTTLTQTIKIWACQWARNGDFTGEQNFEDLWVGSRLLSATPSRQTRANSSCHVRTSDCQPRRVNKFTQVCFGARHERESSTPKTTRKERRRWQPVKNECGASIQ